MNKNESALVLFSGGQDSTTSLYWAKNEFKEVHTIGFHYGQRHHYETEVARNLAKIADVGFDLIEISSLSQLSPNALTNSSIVVDRNKPVNSLPNTFVPGRNLIFLTYAASFAYSRGIRNLVTGVSQTDYSGYPDCRDGFIKSAAKTINLAMESDFVIHTPLMRKNKEAIWEMSDELGIFDLVRYNTLTCYNGIMADGCGRCPACQLREAGLKKYLKKREKRAKNQ